MEYIPFHIRIYNDFKQPRERKDNTMSLNDDKRELLKLKQGLVSEEETVIKESRYKKTELKGKAKAANFLYYYKIHIIVIVFFAAVAAFLVYDTLSKEVKDIRILTVASTLDANTALYMKVEDIAQGFEAFCPDFDKNGNVHVENYNINMSATVDSDYYYSSQAKLYGETATGTAQIYMGDMKTFVDFIGEAESSEMFVNLKQLYPDDKNIVNDYFYKVKGSALTDAANWTESCPDDMYIAVRTVYNGMVNNAESMKEPHERALTVLDNIIKNNRIDFNKNRDKKEE